MPGTITSLTDMAQLLKQIAADALTYTTEGTPSQVFQSPASPADDCCPSLIVWVDNLSEANTSPGGIDAGRRTAYGRVNLATVVIRVMRCAPAVSNTGAVLPAANEAVAAQVNEDAWILWNALYWAVQNGDFLDTCSNVYWESSRYEPEMGGCVGWEFYVSAEIEGIPNPGTT